jgi:5'-3' exonuclease
MGIARLIPFLKSRGLVKSFEGWPTNSIVAVDVPIFAYKFAYSQNSYEGFEAKFIEFAMALKLTSQPIFVFDGGKLELKQDEIIKRSAAKLRQAERQIEKEEKYDQVLVDYGIQILSTVESEGIFVDVIQDRRQFYPTKQYYMNLKLKLESCGFLTATAKFEAEALCAHLVATEKAWCTLTEDTDSLAFGSTRVVFKYLSESPEYVYLPDILDNLQFTMDQFVQLCCLFGCDFVENVYNIGTAKAFALMSQHKCLDEFYKKKDSFALKTAESFLEEGPKWPKAKQVFLSRAHEIE